MGMEPKNVLTSRQSHVYTIRLNLLVAIRIEFDDDEQYKGLKELNKHRGLTWKGLLLEGERKVREDTSE